MKPGILLIGAGLCLACCTAGAQSKIQRKALQDTVAESFKDPGSVQFRKLQLVDGKAASKPGEGLYCGEVNAKNAYGGYVGYMPFIEAVIDDGAFAMKIADDADSAPVVTETCRRAKAGEIGSD